MTWMPSGSTSRRKASDKPSMANLVALHWPSAGMPRRPASDDRLTMQHVVAERDLAARLTDALAHLQRFQPGELVEMGVQQRRPLRQDGCALGVGCVLPGLEPALRRRQCVVELVIASVLEAFQQFAVVEVDTLVGDEDVSLNGLCANQAAWAAKVG